MEGYKTTHFQHLKLEAKSRTARQSPDSRVFYVETLIVVDKIMIKNQQQMNIRRLKNYILMLVNIVSLVFIFCRCNCEV